MTITETNERATIGGNRPPINEVLADQFRGLIAEIDPLAERANALPRKVEKDEDLGPIGDLVVDATKLVKKLEAARKSESDPRYQEWKDVNAFFKPLTERVERISSAFEKIATDYQREKAAEARRKAEDEARKLREAEEKKRQEAEAAKRQTTADRKLDEAEGLADRAEEAEARALASNADLTRIRTESGVTAGTKTIWNFSITDYNAIPLDELRPFLRREDVEKAIRSMVSIQKGATKLAGVHVFEDVKSTFRR